MTHYFGTKMALSAFQHSVKNPRQPETVRSHNNFIYCVFMNASLAYMRDKQFNKSNRCCVAHLDFTRSPLACLKTYKPFRQMICVCLYLTQIMSDHSTSSSLVSHLDLRGVACLFGEIFDRGLSAPLGSLCA